MNTPSLYLFHNHELIFWVFISMGVLLNFDTQVDIQFPSFCIFDPYMILRIGCFMFFSNGLIILMGCMEVTIMCLKLTSYTSLILKPMK